MLIKIGRTQKKQDLMRKTSPYKKMPVGSLSYMKTSFSFKKLLSCIFCLRPVRIFSINEKKNDF